MLGFPFDSQLDYDPETGEPLYDRAVSSQPLRKLIRELFTTGVMPNPSTNLQVSAGTDGMTVQINTGFAVIDGGLCHETEIRTLEVTAADNTYDRIDTVVLRWNENVDARTADLYVVAGTPAANPVRPELQHDNSIYEIGLADVFVTKRVATITNDKITDTRYETGRCGIVSSISEWDTTTIYQQIQAELAGFKANEEAEFATWFDYMKDQLSEDAAGHLQNEIDAIRPRVTTNLLNPTVGTTTVNGVTCTANGDGTYTLKGTATAHTDIRVTPWGTSEYANLIQLEPNKKYKIIGSPSGNSVNTYFMCVVSNNGTTRNNIAWDYNDDGVFTSQDSAYHYEIKISVTNGTTLPSGGLVFKPMITTDLYASYDDYVQYSGDGELNENVAKHEKDIAQLNNDLTDYSVNTPLRNVTYYNGKLYQITSTGQRGSEIAVSKTAIPDLLNPTDIPSSMTKAPSDGYVTATTVAGKGDMFFVNGFNPVGKGLVPVKKNDPFSYGTYYGTGVGKFYPVRYFD